MGVSEKTVDAGNATAEHRESEQRLALTEWQVEVAFGERLARISRHVFGADAICSCYV